MIEVVDYARLVATWRAMLGDSFWYVGGFVVVVYMMITFIRFFREIRSYTRGE